MEAMAFALVICVYLITISWEKTVETKYKKDQAMKYQFMGIRGSKIYEKVLFEVDTNNLDTALQIVQASPDGYIVQADLIEVDDTWYYDIEPCDGQYLQRKLLCITN